MTLAEGVKLLCVRQAVDKSELGRRRGVDGDHQSQRVPHEDHEQSQGPLQTEGGTGEFWER